jgi:hypothetical protein
MRAKSLRIAERNPLCTSGRCVDETPVAIKHPHAKQFLAINTGT